MVYLEKKTEMAVFAWMMSKKLLSLRQLLLLLFLTFSILVANPPKKLLYTVANLVRGLLNREKGTQGKSGSAPPHIARSEKIK